MLEFRELLRAEKVRNVLLGILILIMLLVLIKKDLKIEMDIDPKKKHFSLELSKEPRN